MKTKPDTAWDKKLRSVIASWLSDAEVGVVYTIEDFRKYARERGLEEPPKEDTQNRTWGARTKAIFPELPKARAGYGFVLSGTVKVRSQHDRPVNAYRFVRWADEAERKRAENPAVFVLVLRETAGLLFTTFADADKYRASLPIETQLLCQPRKIQKSDLT